MVQYPNVYLETSIKDKLSSVNKLFSRNQFDFIGYLLIHINDIDVSDYRLISIYSINPMYGKILLDDNKCIHRPWVDVPVTSLNLASGYHAYTMQFVSKHTKFTINLYFSYTIQDDNPDRPYLYLKNSD